MAGQFLNRMKQILMEEGIDYSTPVLAELLMKHFPDYRRVLNELQRYSDSGKKDFYWDCFNPGNHEIDIVIPANTIIQIKTGNLSDSRYGKLVIPSSSKLEFFNTDLTFFGSFSPIETHVLYFIIFLVYTRQKLPFRSVFQ